jgi:hypothetical protein
MSKFKGILVQFLETNNLQEFRNISSWYSDGIYEYDIEAKNEYEAEEKMLNHFYETYWFGAGDEDVPVKEFKNLPNSLKIESLQNMDCQFQHLIYFNPYKTKITKNKI